MTPEPMPVTDPLKRIRFAESLGWTKCRIVAYHAGILACQNPFIVGIAPGEDGEKELPDLPKTP